MIRTKYWFRVGFLGKSGAAALITMREHYIYESEVGPFHIMFHEGLFHPVFQGHDLGAYLTAQHAADDLARGQAFKVPGVDTAALGIPSDLRHWVKIAECPRQPSSPATYRPAIHPTRHQCSR